MCCPVKALKLGQLAGGLLLLLLWTGGASVSSWWATALCITYFLFFFFSFHHLFLTYWTMNLLNLLNNLWLKTLLQFPIPPPTVGQWVNGCTLLGCLPGWTTTVWAPKNRACRVLITTGLARAMAGRTECLNLLYLFNSCCLQRWSLCSQSCFVSLHFLLPAYAPCCTASHLWSWIRAAAPLAKHRALQSTLNTLGMLKPAHSCCFLQNMGFFFFLSF